MAYASSFSALNIALGDGGGFVERWPRRMSFKTSTVSVTSSPSASGLNGSVRSRAIHLPCTSTPSSVRYCTPGCPGTANTRTFVAIVFVFQEWDGVLFVEIGYCVCRREPVDECASAGLCFGLNGNRRVFHLDGCVCYGSAV